MDEEHSPGCLAHRTPGPRVSVRCGHPTRGSSRQGPNLPSSSGLGKKLGRKGGEAASLFGEQGNGLSTPRGCSVGILGSLGRL